MSQEILMKPEAELDECTQISAKRGEYAYSNITARLLFKKMSHYDS